MTPEELKEMDEAPQKALMTSAMKDALKDTIISLYKLSLEINEIKNKVGAGNPLSCDLAVDACADGNLDDNDGCSSACEVEYGYNCVKVYYTNS